MNNLNKIVIASTSWILISVTAGVIAAVIDADHTSGIYIIFGILVGIIGSITNAFHIYIAKKSTLIKNNNWLTVAIATSIVSSLVIITANINNISESYEMFETMMLLLFSLSIYMFITSYIVGTILLKMPKK